MAWYWNFTYRNRVEKVIWNMVLKTPAAAYDAAAGVGVAVARRVLRGNRFDFDVL